MEIAPTTKRTSSVAAVSIPPVVLHRECGLPCPACAALRRSRRQEDTHTKTPRHEGDRRSVTPSSPHLLIFSSSHPLTHARPAASETSTHGAARHSNQAESSSRNLRAVMIGISRKETRFSRCPSPLTTQSAFAATAASRNLLSVGSSAMTDNSSSGVTNTAFRCIRSRIGAIVSAVSRNFAAQGHPHIRRRSRG